MQARRRPPEMQLLGNGNEIAQLAQFQIHVICIPREIWLIYSRNVSQQYRRHSALIRGQSTFWR
jgi:hypothetical protein